MSNVTVNNLDILIDDTSLEFEEIAKIKEMVVHHEVNVPGMFSFELLAETIDSKKWADLGFERFKIGSSITIKMSKSTLIIGDIHSLEPRFDKGVGSIVIRGFDRMN